MSDRHDDGRPAPADAQPDPRPPARLTHEQLERWAELVAAGEAEFPADLSPAQRLELEQRVRQLRRARLVAFIARQIALDLHREQQRQAGPDGRPHKEARHA